MGKNRIMKKADNAAETDFQKVANRVSIVTIIENVLLSVNLQEAHDIAEDVHNDIEQNFPKVKHIMVHVNPAVR